MIRRVLAVHNFYQQRGGEDSVVEAEVALLRSRGHDVVLYARHSDELADHGQWAAGFNAVWSARTAADIGAQVRALKPDVIHAHNTFPLISPSLYWAAARERIPIVQTLHNFRLLCPQAMFLHERRVCEDCIRRIPWRSVTRGCYRDSRLQSAAVTAMLQAHRLLGTYAGKVTRYIALTDFSRRKFVAGGIPADKILVKPNFVEPAPGTAEAPRGTFLFAGRLSPEKGVRVMTAAFRQMPQARLEVLGQGPEMKLLDRLPNVVVRGYQPQAYVRGAMFGARALVVPSICYENFPRTLVEAFACRLPVIASRLGAMAELVKEGVTGLLFEPGDADDLRVKLEWAIAHPVQMRRMGEAAYAEYERKYTPAANYQALLAIYVNAVNSGRGK